MSTAEPVSDEQILALLKNTNGPDGVPLIEWLEVPNKGDAENWGIATHGMGISDIRGEIHDEFHVKLARSLLAAVSHVQAPSARRCTCHPDDSPPIPCAEKYAYSECISSVQRAPADRWTGIGKDDGAVIVRWIENGKRRSLTAIVDTVTIYDADEGGPAYKISTTDGDTSPTPQIDDAMVERGARLLAASYGDEFERMPKTREEAECSDYTSQEEYLDHASAALQAAIGGKP